MLFAIPTDTVELCVRRRLMQDLTGRSAVPQRTQTGLGSKVEKIGRASDSTVFCAQRKQSMGKVLTPPMLLAWHGEGSQGPGAVVMHPLDLVIGLRMIKSCPEMADTESRKVCGDLIKPEILAVVCYNGPGHATLAKQDFSKSKTTSEERGSNAVATGQFVL